jgi:hypothetical protein
MISDGSYCCNLPRLLPVVAIIVFCCNFMDSTTNVVHSLQIPSSSKLPKHLRQHYIKSLSASNTDPSSPTSTSISSLPTLSSDTTWMIRMTLRNIKTQQGQTISNQMYVINGQFIPEENYEPPQGTFVQQPSTTSTETAIASAASSNSNDSSNMQIASSRWILSEDPNDRKDGLWIWGLFQQPLYPYLLLSLETKPIEIRNSGDSLDYIPALQLYVQLNHNCNRDTGAVSFLKTKSSSDGSKNTGSNNYELMIRQKEIIAADPLSLSKVEIYEEVSIGTISIQPK